MPGKPCAGPPVWLEQICRHMLSPGPLATALRAFCRARSAAVSTKARLWLEPWLPDPCVIDFSRGSIFPALCKQAVIGSADCPGELRPPNAL